MVTIYHYTSTFEEGTDIEVDCRHTGYNARRCNGYRKWAESFETEPLANRSNCASEYTVSDSS